MFENLTINNNVKQDLQSALADVNDIISWAKSKLGSSQWDGYCQKFIRQAYEAGGIYGNAATATEAWRKWCISAEKSNIPVGAVVYFNGTDPAVGHVALYIGNGKVINPAKTVYICDLNNIPNYRGWGWQGGQEPRGTYTESETGKSSTSSTKSTSSTSSSSSKKDITSTTVKSVTGSQGVYRFNNLHNVSNQDMYYELLIENDQIYAPVIVGDIEYTIERKGSPSSLKFTVLKDKIINFQEGNPVKFKVNGVNIFYGYIFKKSRKDNVSIDVTAYDQLRYLKNKDSYIYENKTYDQLLKMICEDYSLKLGKVASTGYSIPQRVDDGTLFDILGNASDLTLARTGKLYILYDDFGSVTLKSVEDMILDVYIDETQLQDFDYETSIDSDVYNRVKLAKDNEETGEREFYVFNGTQNQEKWGILQYYEELNTSAIDINIMGKALLNYYNVKGRSLKLNNVFGNTAVRGGSSILVKLSLGDIEVSNLMMVEKVTHKFSAGTHFMDLNLVGIRGEFQ